MKKEEEQEVSPTNEKNEVRLFSSLSSCDAMETVVAPLSCPVTESLPRRARSVVLERSRGAGWRRRSETVKTDATAKKCVDVKESGGKRFLFLSRSLWLCSLWLEAGCEPALRPCAENHTLAAAKAGSENRERKREITKEK